MSADPYNSWRCHEPNCPTRGEWQDAPFPQTAETAWEKHWRREHHARVIDPNREDA